MFQLTFLGTSAGIPTKHRNVTALAVECVNPYLSGDKQKSKSKRPWVLIDCGEGTQHQLLHTKLSVNQLSVICITHVHGDHCYGLPGLLASMAMSGRKEALTLIAPRAIAKFLDALTIATELYFNYPIKFIAIEDVVSDKSNGNHHIQLEFTSNHRLDIDITALSHRVPSYAFSLTQNVNTKRLKVDKLKAEGIPAGEIWGQLQQGHDVIFERESTEEDFISFLSQNEAQALLKILKAEDYVENQSVTTKIVVAGDNDTPNLLTEAINDASLLIHEATYTQTVSDKIATRIDKGEIIDPMHTTAKSIATFAHAVQLPNLILTHFSARYQPFDEVTSKITNMADIRQEVEMYYQGNFWLAQDFAQFLVDNQEVTKLSD